VARLRSAVETVVGFLFLAGYIAVLLALAEFLGKGLV
jgi:hypothetical protein